MSPISNQLFIWYAKREDGSIVYEYDDEQNGYSYDKEIESKKDSIEEFGLIGNGSKIFFNTKDGVITVGNKEIRIYVESGEDGDVYLPITENKEDGVNYKNVIQYKQGTVDVVMDNNMKDVPMRTIGHYIGYDIKTKEFNAQVILNVPIGGTLNIKVTITLKNTDFSGKYCIQYGDYEEQEETLLECGTSKVFETKLY
jgi:hypothetical protein